MAFQLPPLPSFQTQIPQMPNALDQYAKIASLKNMMSETALRQQLAPLNVQEAQQRVQQETTQNQIQQMELKSQQAMMAAWSDPEFTKKITTGDKPTANGLGFDPDAMTSELTSRGVLPKEALAVTAQFVERSQKMASTAKDIAQTGEAEAATSAKGYKILADKIGGIIDMPVDKATAALAVLKQDLVKNPKLFPGVPQQDLAHLFSADLEHLPAIASVIGLDAQIADFHKSKSEAAKAEAGLPGGALESPEARELNAFLAKPGNKGKDAADFVSWKAKQSPMAVVMGNMLGQGNALDQQAELYSQTHELPQGLSRSPGTTSAIIQRAAELHPNQNLAANQADFKASQASLQKLQTVFDQVSAFEGTALRNLDLYVSTVKSIPDLGVKFANVPLRSITGAMVGEKNYAAMQAARQVAATETAKVLGSATASGVLSDSQKKEALEVLDGNLPLAATLKVVDTLKQDFGNRHVSYQMQIQDIKSRTGGAPSQGGATAGVAGGGAGGAQHTPGGQAAGLTEGQTGTGSDGKKYVVKGGVWQPQ
jgi:hypothetical protein